MVDYPIQKALSESVMKVYELMAVQHPKHRDYFLSQSEYLFHKQRLKELDEMASNQ